MMGGKDNDTEKIILLEGSTNAALVDQTVLVSCPDVSGMISSILIVRG